MKVAHGILAIALLVLGNNFASGYVLVPNVEDDLGGSIPPWDQILDTIFETNNLHQQFNFNKNLKNFRFCFVNFIKKKIQIYHQAKKNIRQCFNHSTWNLQHNFKQHSLKHLLYEVRSCKANTDNIESQLECSANAVVKSLKYLKQEGQMTKIKTISCVYFAIEKFFNDLIQNYKIFKDCVLENSYPPTTGSPQSNTTLSSTTPWLNTTLSPWENSTTASPIVNTTLDSNSTWNPWQNTTSTPWLSTTVSPWENNTTVSPNANTTLSSNSTTTILPNVNTTLSPLVNTTAPEKDTTINSNNTTTTDTPLNQNRQASKWWERNWEKVSSIF